MVFGADIAVITKSEGALHINASLHFIHFLLLIKDRIQIPQKVQKMSPLSSCSGFDVYFINLGFDGQKGQFIFTQKENLIILQIRTLQ